MPLRVCPTPPITYSFHQSPPRLTGCVFRLRGLVRIFLFMLLLHFIVSVGTGIWSLVQFFQDSKQEWIDKCIDSFKDWESYNKNSDVDEQNVCKAAYGAARWSVPVVWVIAWILELCELPLRSLRGLI